MNTIERKLPILSINPNIYFRLFIWFAEQAIRNMPYFYSKSFPKGTKDNFGNELLSRSSRNLAHAQIWASIIS